MSQIKSNQFLELALTEIPRLLGQLNRNPSSRSYGSFDRAYWHYRTNDISCARYQEAIYTLALLYFSNFEANVYYRDDKVLEWIRAGLRFTATIQKSNGSFDEWYINEGSYVATAFVTTALSQTLMLFKENNMNLEEVSIISNLIENAANFLIRSKEETVLNQVSGAIFAIALARKDTKNLLEEFLKKQNKEGWWSEYGGPDVGYLTLTISYLEKYRNLTRSNIVDTAIEKAKSFVMNFINPDLTAGGEYMSRNTEYIIPSETLPYVGAIKPEHLDDRYLCYILYNWVKTGLKREPEKIKIPKGENYFEDSGLLRVSNSKYFLVSNARKGGSFRIYTKDKVYYDSGIEVSGFTTGVLDESNDINYQSNNLKSSGVFKKIKEPLMNTKMAIIFKTWQLIFGRLDFLQSLVKNLLRPQMINQAIRSDLSFERLIEHSDDKVVVTDVLRGPFTQDDIVMGVKAAYSAVPSSKYAAVPDIASRLLAPEIETKEEGGSYIIKRIFSIND